MSLTALYGRPPSLLTDLYQLTMAYGYWRQGRADDDSVFHLFFRRNPHGGGFAIAAGAEAVAELVDGLRYRQDDIDYLASLTGSDHRPLFESAFLDWLLQLEMRCDIDAMPEGSVCFAYEPILRAEGPLAVCQLLETPLLNLINFPTLIATKAARVCHLAARGQPVLEFGLRRAQGVDGAMTATRSAWIGGCAATSNVLAGRLFDIPVRGTHAHSWVMAHDSELEAFRAYADAQPNNCTLLIDTYDVRRGVENAIVVARELARRDRRLAAVRIDSGNLTDLSRLVRQKLDEAGLEEVAVVASGDLDEHRVDQLRRAGAAVDIWGIGTRLVTGAAQSSLGGVYKLARFRRPGGDWIPRLKVTDDQHKLSLPGRLGVRRLRNERAYLAGVIYDTELGLHHPASPESPWQLTAVADRNERFEVIASETEEVLRPLVRQGRAAGAPEGPRRARERVAEQMALLPKEVLALEQPGSMPVGLDRNLSSARDDLLPDKASRVGAGAGSE